MSSSRQLNAIMFADIAGYTAMMQEDEELAIQLRHKPENVKEVVNFILAGFWSLEAMGPCAAFTSSTEAVRAAIDLQLDMQPNPTVPLRIGMHTSDVVIEGNTIYGDGGHCIKNGIFRHSRQYFNLR